MRMTEGELVREVKRVTGCNYYRRAGLLFAPGAGARIRFYIRSPFRRYSPFLKRYIRPYLWTWNDSIICRIWVSWATVQLNKILQQTEIIGDQDDE